MMHASAVFASDVEELAFREYVTDCLYLMGRNKVPGMRWLEMVRPKKEDDRSAEEIAGEVADKMGLVIKHESARPRG